MEFKVTRFLLARILCDELDGQSSLILQLFGRCAFQPQLTTMKSSHEKPYWGISSVVTIGNNVLCQCIATRGIFEQWHYVAVYSLSKCSQRWQQNVALSSCEWSLCGLSNVVTVSHNKLMLPLSAKCISCNSCVLYLSGMVQHCSIQSASSAIFWCPLFSIRPLRHTSIGSVCIRPLGCTILCF